MENYGKHEQLNENELFDNFSKFQKQNEKFDLKILNSKWKILKKINLF